MTPTTNLFNYIDYSLTDTTLTTAVLSFLFYSEAAEKYCAPFLEAFIDDDGEISTANFQTIGSYIKAIYQPKWDRLKAVSAMEYDPIHNFSNTTVEDTDDTKGNTRTDNLTRTDNFTRTDNLTRTDDLSNTTELTASNSNTENSIYGFNSDTSVPADVSDTNATNSGESTQTGTVTNTGTQTNNGTSVNTGTQTDAGTYTRDRTVTQTGNIGNISTQKLLNEEIELWAWNLAEQMVTDVMQLLTLSIY